MKSSMDEARRLGFKITKLTEPRSERPICEAEWCANVAEWFFEDGGDFCCGEHAELLAKKLILHEKSQFRKCVFCGVAESLIFVFTRKKRKSPESQVLAVACNHHTKQLWKIVKELEGETFWQYECTQLTSETISGLLGKPVLFKGMTFDGAEEWAIRELVGENEHEG